MSAVTKGRKAREASGWPRIIHLRCRQYALSVRCAIRDRDRGESRTKTTTAENRASKNDSFRLQLHSRTMPD